MTDNTIMGLSLFTSLQFAPWHMADPLRKCTITGHNLVRFFCFSLAALDRLLSEETLDELNRGID